MDPPCSASSSSRSSASSAWPRPRPSLLAAASAPRPSRPACCSRPATCCGPGRGQPARDRQPGLLGGLGRAGDPRSRGLHRLRRATGQRRHRSLRLHPGGRRRGALRHRAARAGLRRGQLPLHPAPGLAPAGRGAVRVLGGVVLRAGLVLAVLALAAGAPRAVAGDAAGLEFLGFSRDASHLAFEQYGIRDGSGFPYSEVFLVDVARNRFRASAVLGGP
ncbi:MAG: hypothetical protein C4333_10405, partial [Meiothermus sp.]